MTIVLMAVTASKGRRTASPRSRVTFTMSPTTLMLLAPPGSSVRLERLTLPDAELVMEQVSFQELEAPTAALRPPDESPRMTERPPPPA